MPDSDYIPLMFQAQVRGRSLIHKLEDLKKKAEDLGVQQKTLSQQAYDWAEQWQDSCDINVVPIFSDHVHKSKPYPFTWRMVTNSGQDEGVIRPVIGERGWAYFPGSSMKGAFLRACRKLHPDRCQRYCGGEGQDKELRPGILRFHGGYPTNDTWLDDSMVDIVHPQENWQGNGTRLSHETPKVQISLYQPTFIFGISSTDNLSDAEWIDIWQIWDKALERGIGSRVSAGYGQIRSHGESRLLPVYLIGQGITSQRIDKQGEFRPNVFKAALRGHTRRLFNGIADQKTADRLTKELWGGIGKGESATVGLLGIAFHAPNLELDEWRAVGQQTPVSIYDTGDATLDILVMDDRLLPERREELKIFVIRLMKFSMLVGGFGKSWRRADHRLFMPNYKRQIIGCHWEFTPCAERLYIPTEDNLLGIQQFLKTFHQKAQDFSWLTEIADRQRPSQIWKEAWCKGNVQVWGRIAEDKNDSLAIQWFHENYCQGRSIKQSDLTGSMNRIGRIWHRMYPRYVSPKAKKDPPCKTEQFVELLTIFPGQLDKPEEAEKTAGFLKFIDQATDFQQLW